MKARQPGAGSSPTQMLGACGGLKSRAVTVLGALERPRGALGRGSGHSAPHTVHKHRRRLGHAPKRLTGELNEDKPHPDPCRHRRYREAPQGVASRTWKLACRAVADRLEKAGDRLFSFKRVDPSQWKFARTTSAITRLNAEFRRRINSQIVLPCAETVPVLLWALLASGQIQMRKVDVREILSQPLDPMSRPRGLNGANVTCPPPRWQAIPTTFARGR